MKRILAFFPFLLNACNELGSQIISQSVHVQGVFPRFPHNVEQQTTHNAMIMYTPDDFSSKQTWESIGYPNEGFFKLHNAFPKIKYSIQACPENRYIGEQDPKRKITEDPIAAQTWRDFVFRQDLNSWAELGNHGLTHSPMGDPNFDHHEFDSTHNPHAKNLDWTRSSFQKSMNAFNQIGIPTSKIMVMRFPGFKKTKQALQAAQEAGILAYFDFHNYSGAERWIQLDSNQEILEIPDVFIHQYGLEENHYDYFKAFVQKIYNGQVDSTNFKASQNFQHLVDKNLEIMEIRIHSGGIVNFFDHWWEHSRFKVKGIYPRYEIFLEVLHRLDTKYGKHIWWGFGSEFARWAYFKRYVQVKDSMSDHVIYLDFHMKKRWDSDWNMPLSFDLLAEKGEVQFPKDPFEKIEVEYQGKRTILDRQNYWSDGNSFRINFEFKDGMRLILYPRINMNVVYEK